MRDESENNPAGHATRILVVDDHPLICEGLAARIAIQPDMQICGEAASVDEAIAQVNKLAPDLIIVDLKLAESNGMDLIKTIHDRFSHVKMLVVSAFEESLYAERSLRAGAHG